MTRRPELQPVAVNARAREAWQLVCARRGCSGCPGGALIGPGGEGKRLPAAMALNGHSALIANQEGGVKEGKLLNDGGRVKTERRTWPVTTGGHEWVRLTRGLEVGGELDG
jgi:hypothetical protein